MNLEFLFIFFLILLIFFPPMSFKVGSHIGTSIYFQILRVGLTVVLVNTGAISLSNKNTLVKFRTNSVKMFGRENCGFEAY